MQKYPNVRLEYADQWMNRHHAGIFPNLIEAVRHLGYNACINNCKKRLYDGCLAGWNGYGAFVIYDERGRIIDPEIIRSVAENHAKKKRDHRWKRNFVYRRGPVEGIGVRHWHRGVGPATTQERRENDFINHDEDAIQYNVRVRPKRINCNLPTSWDDWCYRGSQSQSWKGYRKEQWKAK